ncbi:hypothetical protein As57867_020373, partial [Aphanomyces stellatus]
DMIYTQDAIKDLLVYAKAHGIQVVPEVDAPAHAGAGWQWGPDYGLGELTLCWAASPTETHQCWEAPCGQLNPLNENVYPLLDLIWGELHALFDSDIFHMGSDEVFTKCWMDTPEIANLPEILNKSNDADYWNVWAKFQKRVMDNFWKRAPNKKIALWSSDLTTPQYFAILPKEKVVIHSWNPTVKNEPRTVTDLGYSYIASFDDAFYLDCGFNGIDRKDNSWCAPFKTWQVIYEQLLDVNVTAANKHLVLGGSAVLWTEVSGEAALDNRLWPRVSAFAERAWSNPMTRWHKAMQRMTIQAYRIIETGVQADMIQPHWCRQRAGECPMILWGDDTLNPNP